jgi:hypothetical protein
MSQPFQRPTKVRRGIDSRDIPVSSLVAAKSFAKRFLVWCANADITGPIDWPKLFEHSQAYAVEEEIRPVSYMALAKALTQLGVRKTSRPLKKRRTTQSSVQRAERRQASPCQGLRPAGRRPIVEGQRNSTHVVRIEVCIQKILIS